jgi:hypothetical protein
MESNAKMFGIFIKLDEESEVLVEWLRNFYQICYEIEASTADIITDALFDMFLRSIAEKKHLKE